MKGLSIERHSIAAVPVVKDSTTESVFDISEKEPRRCSP
jgi:hypothetical protein